jgi:2-(1,2-epoxy-1,2-dihydrophenyl)acetyl-CoA isomerase
LNRPERLNALTVQMADALMAALAAAEADNTCRAVLLTGAGRGFCAGQDLTAIVDAGSDEIAALLGHYNPLISRLRALPLPVVCAVNGVAAGAGANLALACDIVLAAKSANFIEAFCKLGLIPDTGGTWHLPRMIGLARATGLAMLGDKLDAETAERWGLIWKAIPDAGLMQDARAMAEHFAVAPTKGLAFTKKALQASFHNTLEQQLQLEAGMMRELGYSHDYREGVQAFIEKRPAHFKGE